MVKFKKGRIYYFLLGMLVMLILDMIFHFNNSVEAKIDREVDQTKRKIENLFK